jgi:O-antigen/teichoic acid export membrane protein
MARRVNFLNGSPGRLFLLTRVFSSGIALLMALYYTKLIGLERRSILSFIMVSALILTVLFTSGISLTFRNQPKNRINGDSLFGFLILILAGSLLVGSISTLLLKYFSYLQGSLPTSIYIACFLYSALGCINLGVTDGLIANGNLRLASYFDFSSIIFQLLFLFFLVQLDQTTIFMSIMISFIVSYLLITFAAFSVFFHAYAINVEKMFKSGINLIVESKNNQIFGIANGFIDRMDRFIIGLALPLVLLAKYSLITGIISYSRFLPEAINKLRVQKLRQSEHNVNSLFFKRSSSRITNLVVAILSMGLTFLAMAFVSLIFGKEWSLPIEIPLLFTLQELMRAAYQMKATTEITNGNSSYVNRLSLFLLIFSTLLMILGVNIFGIIAAPLSMIITYSVLIYVISRKIWVLS